MYVFAILFLWMETTICNTYNELPTNKHSTGLTLHFALLGLLIKQSDVTANNSGPLQTISQCSLC